jgi:hypothetical protein
VAAAARQQLPPLNVLVEVLADPHVAAAKLDLSDLVICVVTNRVSVRQHTAVAATALLLVAVFGCRHKPHCDTECLTPSPQVCDDELVQEDVDAEELTDALFTACVGGSRISLSDLLEYDNRITHMLGAPNAAGSAGRQGKKAQQQQQQQAQLLEQLLMTCIGCQSPQSESCVRHLIDAAPAVRFLSECGQPAECDSGPWSAQCRTQLFSLVPLTLQTVVCFV